MKSTEQALHDHRVVVDGLLTSQKIRRIRKKLKLTQKEAAEIFGGGPNAFSRYELGESTPVRAVFSVITERSSVSACDASSRPFGPIGNPFF